MRGFDKTGADWVGDAHKDNRDGLIRLFHRPDRCVAGCGYNDIEQTRLLLATADELIV